MAKAPISLHSFYVAINEWINAGCPAENKYDFSSSLCLCTNHARYLRSQGASVKQRHVQQAALANSFQKAGLYPYYPFNTSGDHYKREVISCTIYQNPARLAWIAKQLNKGKSHAPHNL